MKYPNWFDYEVKSFLVSNTDAMNDELIKYGVDAKDIISIVPIEKHPTLNDRFKVFFRMKVEHS